MKGSTYEVGDKIDEDVHYGEWNAVLIDKHWRFINAYWGTCSEAPELQPAIENHVDEDYGDVTGRLCYQCDENYFLTDSDQMVATHLPAISKWQLKKHPISFREFEEMTFVKDRYFNLRLKILSHPKCLVRSDTGEVELRFGIPRKSSLNLDFQYLLFKVDEKNHTEKRYEFESEGTIKHVTLNRKCYNRRILLDFSLTVKAAPHECVIRTSQP